MKKEIRKNKKVEAYLGPCQTSMIELFCENSGYSC